MTQSDDGDHGAHVEARRHERRRVRLINRLPARVADAVHWLLKPQSRWARIPAGALFIVGGCLSILPVFGLWMLPVGAFLIAEDVPAVRRRLEQITDWIEKRRPLWFAGPDSD